MTTAPDPGMVCPECGRVFATFGNVTNMPCTACAYRRLDAQAAHIVKLETAAIGRNFAKYEQALTLCQAYADQRDAQAARIEVLEKALLRELEVCVRVRSGPFGASTDILRLFARMEARIKAALSPASDGTAI